MQAYVEALAPLAVSDADLSQPGSWNSAFQKLAESTAGDSSAKMKVPILHPFTFSPASNSDLSSLDCPRV